MRSRRLLVPIVALTLSSSLGRFARAQDNGSPGEPIVEVAPAALTYDLLGHGTLPADDPANHKFSPLQAAYAAAPEGTADKPTVIGIAPNVYRLPGTASGVSLTITK